MSGNRAKLRARLEAAMAACEAFGPSDPKAKKQRVSGKLLVEVLLGAPAENAGRLWLRNCLVKDELRLAGCTISPRLRFEGCKFEGGIDVEQAVVSDLEVLDCELDRDLDGKHLSVDWDLSVIESKLKRLLLQGAKIGGALSLDGSKFEGGHREEGAAIDASQLVVKGGINCNNASVTGEFSIPGAEIGGPVTMEEITLEVASKKAKREGARVFHADTTTITGFLHANGMEADGEVRLCGGRIDGQLTLSSARIEGELALLGTTIGDNVLLEGAKLLNAEGVAMRGDGLDVRSAVMMNGEFRVEGELRIPGAVIGSHLSLQGAVVEGQVIASKARIEGELRLGFAELISDGNYALVANGLIARGGFSAYGEFDAIGGVLLRGAEIGGNFVVSNATLTQSGGTALQAEGIRVEGSMRWQGKTEITGNMILAGAHISERLSIDATLEKGMLIVRDASLGSDMLLNASKLINKEGPSIVANRVKVGGSFITRQGFESGEMIFLAAKLAGFSIEKATLSPTARRKQALRCDAMQVSGNLNCKDLNAGGEVRLARAHIGGQVNFKGATLKNLNAALIAERIEVAHGMFLDEGFDAVGLVALPGARIHSALELSGAKIKRPGTVALDLRSAKIEQLRLCPKHINGAIDLSRAEVQSLRDAENGKLIGLPEGPLHMDGFTYHTLEEPLSASQRKPWLEASQQKRFYPGVYAELASALRRIGHTGDARKVAIFGQRKAHDSLSKCHPLRAWHNFLYGTVGYGYYNWWALGWLAVAIVVGGAVLSCFQGDFVKVLAVKEVPDLNVWLYAIDATVPFLETGQQKAWATQGCMAWWSTFLSTVGYALVTAVLAASAALLTRDQQ